MRSMIFGSADIPEQAKGKVYAGGVLAVLLYGCESWCLTAESVRRLSNWHNKRIREMCRVAMCQTFKSQVKSYFPVYRSLWNIFGTRHRERQAKPSRTFSLLLVRNSILPLGSKGGVPS